MPPIFEKILQEFREKSHSERLGFDEDWDIWLSHVLEEVSSAAYEKGESKKGEHGRIMYQRGYDEGVRDTIGLLKVQRKAKECSTSCLRNKS